MTNRPSPSRRAMIVAAAMRVAQGVNLYGGPTHADLVGRLSLEEIELLNWQDGGRFVDEMTRVDASFRRHLASMIEPIHVADARTLAERLPDGRYFRRKDQDQ